MQILHRYKLCVVQLCVVDVHMNKHCILDTYNLLHLIHRSECEKTETKSKTFFFKRKFFLILYSFFVYYYTLQIITFPMCLFLVFVQGV